MRNALSLLAVLVTGASLAACGSSSSAPASLPQAPSDTAAQSPANVPVDAPSGSTASAPMDNATFEQFVFDDTVQYWDGKLAQRGVSAPDPTLVRYPAGATIDTGCGTADSSAGPFYCPNDNNVYLSDGFVSELRDKYGSPGDFALAYVIAHEVGHHVQQALGITDQVQQAQAQTDQVGANQLSQGLELQADCLAGVWGNSTKQRGMLQAGDLDEALNAASQVGDDTLQARAGMTVNPDTWNHGSSQERRSWFLKGFQSGDMNQCKGTFESVLGGASAA